MDRFWWWPFGRVPDIAAQDLYASLQNAATAPLILDVRTHVEWKAGHVAGAINVPITELSDLLPTLGLSKDHPVVAICLSAHRSIPAVRLLKAHGVANVQQLQGGMRAWWKAGLPCETPA
jgi:rhodanese-related sulfurtransferase